MAICCLLGARCHLGSDKVNVRHAANSSGTGDGILHARGFAHNLMNDGHVLPTVESSPLPARTFVNHPSLPSFVTYGLMSMHLHPLSLAACGVTGLRSPSCGPGIH